MNTEEISLVPCELTPLRSRCIYESEVRHVGDIVDGFHRKRAAMDTETLQVKAFGNEDIAPSNEIGRAHV